MLKIPTAYHSDCRGLVVPVVLVVSMLLAAGCHTAKVEVVPPPVDKEQVWQLVEMQGRPVGRNAATVTIAFNPATGMLRGHAACNSYSAVYTLSPLVADGRSDRDWCALAISNVAADSIRCPEADMNAEARYLARLRQCNRLALADAGNTLLLGNKDKAVLIFELQ